MISLKLLCFSVALLAHESAATELPKQWWLITDEDPFASLLAELGDAVPSRLRGLASEGLGGGLTSSDRTSRLPQRPLDNSRVVPTTQPPRIVHKQARPTRRPAQPTRRPTQPNRRPPQLTRRPGQKNRQPALPPRQPPQPEYRPTFNQHPPQSPTRQERPLPRPNAFDPVNSSGAQPGGPIIFPTERPDVAGLIPSGETGVKCTCVPAEACPGRRKETVGSCSPGNVCCAEEYTPKCGRLLPKSPMAENDVRDSDAPWAAAILEVVDGGFIFVCSGSLIHRQVVLTSARCVNGLTTTRKESLMVRLGEKDILSTDELYPHLEIGVQDILLHQNYSRQNGHNDLALLFLREPATLRPGLDTICVSPALGPRAQTCTIQTYGLQKPGFHGYDLRLRETGQTPIPHRDCQRILRSSGQNPFLQLHEGFTCTERDVTCDLGEDHGGSSLTCADLSAGEHRLRGVLSWGIGCTGRQNPGVYMDVQDYFSWIDFHVTDYFRYFESYFGFNQV